MLGGKSNDRPTTRFNFGALELGAWGEHQGKADSKSRAVNPASESTVSRRCLIVDSLSIRESC
jgi:hypothetical protein